MKKILFVLLAILIAIGNAKSQTTYNPSVKSRNNYCDIESVTLTNQYTIVRIRVPKSHYKSASINSATVLVPIGEWPIEYARQSNLDLTDFPGFSNDSYINSMLMKTIENNKENRKQLSDLGYLIRGLGDDKLDTNYKPAKGAESFVFTLYFDRLSEGIDEFYIREITKTGWEWYGVKINNPRPASLITSYNANSIKTKIDSQSDGIVGIYEGTTTNENRYTLGCIKDNGIYKLIYLDCRQNTPQWQVGEVKCVLTPTATNGFFKGDWYMANKSKNDNCYITFTGATMSVLLDGTKEEYIKMYPTSTGNGIMTEPIEWSGSGFALNNGYFVTNYHVVEDAKSIIIKGIKGNFENAYNAEVVATDKYNDLALLKINDSRFTGFGTIPYKVKTSTSDVGEEIFVLGFPLTSTMGDEIKLTTGVISSKTGFQGDVSLYQISAPVQPGNSGGPLFDSKGDLIGIVSSKHTGAENVGYAIKASYLKNLVESVASSSVLPSNNTISSQPLTGKVKSVQNFVFMIECSMSNTYNSHPITTSSNSTTGHVNNESSKSIMFSNVFLDTNELRFELIGIDLNDNNTILVKRCVPKHEGKYFIFSDYSEFIEDAETNEKYYLIESSITMNPEKTISTVERTFTETYPKLPTKVKVINVWSGSAYYVKNYRIR